MGLAPPDGGGEIEWLGEFPGALLFVNNPTGDLQGAAVGPIAFSPWSQVAANGSAVWIGYGGWDSLVVVGSDRTRRGVRLPLEEEPVPDDLITQARREELRVARDPRSRSFIEARYSRARLPRSLPLVSGLVPGPDGEIWIRYGSIDPRAPVRYLIVDREGTPRGAVAFAAGFRVRDPASGHVVGVQVDGDGVESVLLLALKRSAREGAPVTR